MTKKLLILVSKIGERTKVFKECISKGLADNAEVFAIEFSDLIFEIEKGKISVEIEGNKNLTDFDFVYFRRAGSDYVRFAGAVAISLDFFGIKYVDSCYRNLGRAGSKFTSLIRLAAEGFSIAPTFFCWNTKIKKYYPKIVEKLGLPFVAKNTYSQRGSGIFLVKREKDLDKIIADHSKGQFLFQKYIPSDEEYRVLVLENEIGAFERKIRTDENEFRQNVSLGAREEFIDIKNIPDEIKEISLNACRVLDIQIGGVDILVDKQKKPHLLEVNRGPGITYDSPDSCEVESLVKYFRKKLNG